MHTKAEEPNLPDYLSTVNEKMVGFIPFNGVLAICEMQAASFMSECIIPTSLLPEGYDTGSVLKQSKAGLNSEFSFR